MFKPFDKRQLLLITIFIITILLISFEDFKSVRSVEDAVKLGFGMLIIFAIPIILYNLFPTVVGIIGYFLLFGFIGNSISEQDSISIVLIIFLAVAIGTKFYTVDKLYELAIHNKFNTIVLLLLILTAISTTVIAFKL